MKASYRKGNEVSEFARNYPFLLATLLLSAAAYMFALKDVLFILAYLVMLYFSGKMFTDYASGRRFIWLFLLSLSGSLITYSIAFTFATETILNQLVYSLAGASLGVLTGLGWLLPDFAVRLILIGSVRLKYIVMAVIAYNVLTINPKQFSLENVSLGAIIAASIYMLFFKYRFVLRDRIKRFRRRKPRVVYRNPGERPLTDEQYNEIKISEQRRIDAILDKIKHNGYESLSREEKELLFNASRK
jgi:hypothetical protein